MADKERKERDPDAPDLRESDAEAPGPITPEHESGSWEQTEAQQKAQEEADEAQEKAKSSSSGKSSGSSSSKSSS
jgi:hypothetical protein